MTIVILSGGGLIENIPRVLPHGLGVSLDASSWSMPSVFGWLFGQGNVATHEMVRTFNCGIGAALIVGQEIATSVMEHLSALNEKAWIIGKVTENREDVDRVIVNNLESVLCESAKSADIKHQDDNETVKRPKLSSVVMERRKKMKVGVLISGSGTNLQALIDHSLREGSSAEIAVVISNVPGVQGLTRAQTAGIPTKVSLILKTDSTALCVFGSFSSFLYPLHLLICISRQIN